MQLEVFSKRSLIKEIWKDSKHNDVGEDGERW